MFLKKNVNFRRAAQKTEGWAGRMHKKAVRRVAEKGGAGGAAEKGHPLPCLFLQASLMCSSSAHGKSMFFIWQHGPPFSVIHTWLTLMSINYSLLQCCHGASVGNC